MEDILLQLDIACKIKKMPIFFGFSIRKCMHVPDVSYPLTMLRSTKYILFTRNHAERFYLSIPIDSKNTANRSRSMHMADDTLVVSSAVNVLMSFVLDQVNSYLHVTNFKPALNFKRID